MNNTVTRTLSGIGFLAVVLGGLLVNQYLYAALFLLMMGTMLYEFYRMTMGQAYRYSQILAILLGITAFSLVFSVFAFGLDIRFLCINACPNRTRR